MGRAGRTGAHGHPQEKGLWGEDGWGAVGEKEAQSVSWTRTSQFPGGPLQLPLCPPSHVLPAILLITTQNSDFVSTPSEPSVGITDAG